MSGVVGNDRVVSHGGHGFKAESRYDVAIHSAPTIAATGFGSYKYWFEQDMAPMNTALADKPPYAVSSMQEIAAIPWNGLSVVSTFSGCGGSCLGYRMAGYRVLWANEFVPAAQASYRANADPNCYLDCRDIREVTAQNILAQTGLVVGGLDLFDGSPPCQAFSMAGKRANGWGTEKTYAHGARQKNETLFTEYIRLLAGLQPKVFLAENVSGLVKGVAKGYFKEILAALKACGYRVEAKLLDAQWLGVPQMRQRILFQGTRMDLDKAPAWPKPLPYRYSVRDALPHIMDNIHDTGGFVKNKHVTEQPLPSVTIGVNSCNSSHYLVRHDESGKRSQGDITDKPAPTVRSGRAATMFLEGANGFNHHAEHSVESPAASVQASRSVSLVAPSRRGGHGYHARDIHPDEPCGTVTTGSPGNDLPVLSRLGRRKLTIAEVKRLCGFPDDFVLVGSYAQQWERLGNAVPPVMMAHVAREIAEHILLHDIRGFCELRKGAVWDSGVQSPYQRKF